MATIVDALTVTLGIDPSGFKKGQEEANRAFAKVKDQAAKSGKEIEESNKKVGETFAKVRNEAIGLFVAFLGARGIKEFVSDLNTANASLGRFGLNIGASPQLVSGWEKAVERMGGTSEEAAGSLDAISKALWQVHNMGQPLPEELYRLQGGLGKIASTTFDTEHGVVPFMNDVAAQAQKLAAIDPQSAFRLLQGAGISEATANTMIKYGAGMGAYADSLGRALGPTKDAIKGAQDLQDAWGRVRQTVDGIGNNSIPALDKAMTPVLNKFADFLQKFRDAEKATEGHSVPIPWGDWFRNTEKFLDIGAHAEELPSGGGGFDEGAFESRRGQALSNLTFQGQGVSRGNPLPVDIVKTSLPQSGGDPNGFLGGPIGSGGPLPSGRGGGRGAPGSLRTRGTGAYEGSAGDGDATSGSFMDALARIESTNQNIHSRVDPDPPGYPGGNSQGYFQINTPTWREFAAGTRGAAYPNAMSAPRDVQAEVAARIPLSRFGPRTQRLLAIQFGALNTHDTIGALAAHFGGKPAANATGSGGMSPAGGPWVTVHGKRYQTDKNGNVLPSASAATHHNAPAWWSGVPLASNGAPTGGARLSSLAAGHAVTTSQTSNALHINGGIHVNAPNATDANGIASELTASLERSTMAMLAQSGQV